MLIVGLVAWWSYPYHASRDFRAKFLVHYTEIHCYLCCFRQLEVIMPVTKWSQTPEGALAHAFSILCKDTDEEICEEAG